MMVVLFAVCAVEAKEMYYFAEEDSDFSEFIPIVIVEHISANAIQFTVDWIVDGIRYNDKFIVKYNGDGEYKYIPKIFSLEDEDIYLYIDYYGEIDYLDDDLCIWTDNGKYTDYHL